MSMIKDANVNVGRSNAPRLAERSDAHTTFALNAHPACQSLELLTFPDRNGNDRGPRPTIAR
jgi:hypothetical protein